MKEVTFIRRNIDKWKEAEKVVEQATNLSPDRLADVYTDLTADLAFAQTHFPTSRISIYLNNLASALHNKIYQNKREDVYKRQIYFFNGSEKLNIEPSPFLEVNHNLPPFFTTKS